MPLQERLTIEGSCLKHMVRMLYFLFAGGFLLGCPAVAWALDPPAPIKIDTGPLGVVNLSGGIDGFAYGLTGSGNSRNAGGALATNRSSGGELMNALVQLQKSDGVFQYNIAFASVNSFILGTRPSESSRQSLSTGPLYAGDVSLAPNKNFVVSAGIVPSLEGFESSLDWYNSNPLTTSAYYVENTKSIGVTARGTIGPVAVTVTYSDGYNTGVFNFIQGLVTYTVNPNNVLNVYGASNLGHTGSNAHFYGSTALPYNRSFVGSGPTSAANLANSSLAGAYYSYTQGNINIVPEIQFIYAKPDSRVGLTKTSSNFGGFVFASYKFGTTPWSLGSWAGYFNSSGPDLWFINPRAKGVEFSIGPTWQKDHFFARSGLGVLRLINVGSGPGYGTKGNGRTQATAMLEAGILF